MFDPFFMSKARRKELQAAESDAMQIGRDDRRAQKPVTVCPFEEDSMDGEEWRQGWIRERNGQ